MKTYRLRKLLFSGIVVYVLVSALVLGWFSLQSVRERVTHQGIEAIEHHARMLKQVLLEHRELSPDQLQEYVAALGADTPVRITVIDARGTVLADSSADPSQMDNHADREEVARALAGEARAAVRFSDSVGYDMVYFALPIALGGQSGALRTSLPMVELQSSQRAVSGYVAAGSLLFLGIALLFAWLLISKIERPLAELAERAARFSRLEFHSGPSGGCSVREVQVVAESLQTMAGELQRQFSSMQYQRDELRAVLDSMSEGVIVLDEQLRVLEANPSANRFFAKKRQPLDSRPIQSVIKSPELYDSILNTAEDGESRSTEITQRRSSYHINVTSVPSADETVLRQVVLVCNDITQLMHLERVRRDFVANVSHELKTPITSINGFSETLLEDNFSDLERSRRFTEIIHRQSLRLQAIIDDLLTLSSLEQPQRDQFTSAVPVVSIIKDAVLICREKTRQLNRPIQISCDDSLGVRGNAHLIEQALINLVENAMKYSDPAFPIAVVCRQEEQEVLISITDRGYGIPKHDIPRIFERFYRVDKARSRDKGGTGLGLSIVKHIMLQHQGQVEVESMEGEGSTFTLRFPV